MSGLRDAFFLAIRYLASEPVRTLVLVLGTTVALFLPSFTYLASDLVSEGLLQRAESSPILIGAEGNEFDLTMGALYFRGQVRNDIEMALRDEVEDRGYGTAVPLHLRYSVGGTPLVGTSVEYFDARTLSFDEGRPFAVLGEVVAGARAAEIFALSVGDKVRSDLTNLYNLAGSYPVVLDVAGILEPTGGPDDEAFFADVHTTWLLDGRLHGHEQVVREEALNPEADEGENLEATAAIFIFSELTEENRAAFHMHGETGDAPLSAVLVYPQDQRAHDQLLADYALNETRQAVEPVAVVRTVLGIVLRVRDLLDLYFLGVALSTLCFSGLVLGLSLRLRKAELDLMRRIGCARGTIGAMVFAEVGIVLGLALLAAATLSWLAWHALHASLGV